MAETLSTTNWTMTAQEVYNLAEVINQVVLESPLIGDIHEIVEGITMKTQIAILNQMGLSGILDANCDRPNSGSSLTTAQKYFEPVKIGDTFEFCPQTWDSLMKTVGPKLKQYSDKYNLTNEWKDILMMKIAESLKLSIPRIVWLSDTAVAAATSGAAGLKSAANVKYFNQNTGLWKQIFAGVTATTIKKVTISENAQTTTALQLALAANKAQDTMAAMWKAASPRLQNNQSAQFLLSGEMFQNYKETLLNKGVVYDINILQNGLQTLSYQGFKVVNMATVWDMDLKAYFVDNTTNNAHHLPNRAVFVAPENTKLATIAASDFTNIEAGYESTSTKRQVWMSYGYMIDAKIIFEDEIVAAY